MAPVLASEMVTPAPARYAANALASRACRMQRRAEAERHEAPSAASTSDAACGTLRTGMDVEAPSPEPRLQGLPVAS